MLNAFKTAGVGYVKRHLGWWCIKTIMTSGARKRQTLLEIEVRLRQILGNRTCSKGFYTNALKRAKRSFETIKEYLAGSRVLDLGAGDGLLAQTIQERTDKEVILVDVVDYRLTPLPILLYPQDGYVPLEDNAVDTTILYGTLHHADDPLHVLTEAIRVTKQRVVILEGYIDDPDIYLINCFLDWYFNRAIKNKDVDINMSLSFHTTKEWREIFSKLGLDLVKIDIIGIDGPLVPTYHVLFVLDKAQALSS